MCGRYYVDDETARKIEKVIRQVDEKLRQDSMVSRENGSGITSRENGINLKSAGLTLQARDIHPTETAPVLAASNQTLCCRWQRWGLPVPQGVLKEQQKQSGFSGQGKQVVFNARSESALEKKMFRESVEHRRIVIPATWFYEWNRQKEKNIFYRKSQPVLFMAGFYNRYQDEDRFVILTTAANPSMQPVHDRMPLVLEQDEIVPWIFEREKTEGILHKVPCLLERRTEFEQMSLF